MAKLIPFADERDRSIDGMRGILSSSVALAHLSAELGYPPFFLQVIGPIAPVAVSMFAALSGYVLCASFLKRPVDSNVIKGFYIRRFFRLGPVYVCYFLIAVAGIVSINGWPSARTWITLLSDLFMLDLVGFGWALKSPTWSLYPEVIFSAVLPIWYLFVGNKHSFRFAVAAYLALIVFQWAATPTGPSDRTFVFLRFFFLGIALYHVCGAIRREGAASRYLLPIMFIFGVFLLFTFSGAPFLEGALNQYRRVTISYHQDTMIVLILIPVICNGMLKRIFSMRPLVFLGAISYGVYILHAPLMLLLNGQSFDLASGKVAEGNIGQGTLGVWTSLLYWIVTIAIATIIHFLIETPGIEYGRRLGRSVHTATEIKV